MQRFFTVVWLLHVPLLGAWAVLVLLFPEFWIQAPQNTATSGLSALTSTLQYSAGPMLGLMVAAMYAAMREDPAARKRIARALAIGFGAFAAAHHFRNQIADFRGMDRVLVSQTVRDSVVVTLATALGGFNLLAWIWPTAEPTERQLSGRADTKPQSMWLIWTLQLVVLVVMGGVLIYWGEDVVWRALARPERFQDSAGVLAKRELLNWAILWTQRIGALWLGLGVLAIAGIPETRVSEWRGFRMVHLLTFAAIALAALVASNAAIFAQWVMVVTALLPTVFLVANAAAARNAGSSPPEEVGDPPDGWTFMDLVAGPIIAFRVLLGKRRGTHGLGVAARGHWEPAPSTLDPVTGERTPDGIPEHPWFFPSTERTDRVETTMRFANVTFGDDAGMDVRGAALRIAPLNEPFVDILMNTGSCGPIENVVEFALLVFSKFLPHAVVVALVKKNRKGREGGISGLRLAPESYALLHFYSQSTRYWLTSDDERWLVRYRLLPADPDVPESGVPTLADDLVTWDRTRRPGDTRARDYLRRELKQRLDHVPIKMLLQAQFHLPGVGDDLSWYNGMFDWPHQTHPWRTLGTVVLTTALSDGDAEQLYFDPSVHPPSLGVPVARDALDPRSPADSERRVIARTARLRKWMYHQFGLPTFGANVKGE